MGWYETNRSSSVRIIFNGVLLPNRSSIYYELDGFEGIGWRKQKSGCFPKLWFWSLFEFNPNYRFRSNHMIHGSTGTNEVNSG